METPSPELVTTRDKVLEIGLYYDPSDFQESDIVLEIVSYQDLYACNNSEIGVCLRKSIFISKLIPSLDTNYHQTSPGAAPPNRPSVASHKVVYSEYCDGVLASEK